ncbi:hypothetical protein [Flavobacterium suzhouense]|uniref:Uncharacterized protein n=1 Tax=Flavobacterium suzhouense TaxID=1529638 RepID=A0ABW5NXB5_9FLAO
MKHKLKISLLFSALLIVLFSACQSDELNVNKQSQEIDKVSASELLMLLKNPDIKKSILKNNEKRIDGSVTIDSYFEKLDFADYDNYTLLFSNYSVESPFYKTLVVTIDNYGVENGFYVQYTPTEENYSATQPFNVKKFMGQVDVTDLEGNPRASWMMYNGFVSDVFEINDCETTISITVIPCSHGGLHAPGETCEGDFANDAYYQITIHVSCGPQYIFAGGYAGSNGDSSNGGGTGTAPSSSEVFYGKLSLEQQQFLDNNPKVKSNIQDFFSKFSYANQIASDYAKKMIDEMIETGLIFDVGRSFKSPVNIDVTNIDNSPEGMKFKKVYDKLTDIPKFKELFVKLFAENSSVNTIFKIDNLPVDGTTQLVASPQGVITNQITIDRNTLLTSSDIRIARIIIHECIHAFLNVKLKHPNIGMSIPDINNMDFTEVINTLYNGLQGNPAQHNFFVDHMIPVMTEVLSQGKQVLLTQEQIAKVDNPEESGSFIFAPTNSIPPTNSGIPTTWIWSDFFKYFSLEGLHMADSFDTVYPINSVERYYFEQYTTRAIIAFAP